MKNKKQLWILLLVFIFSTFLWYIPYANIILYPFKLFATFIHEFGHAITAIITGGGVYNLIINPDASGLTITSGGLEFIILSGGYLGSTLVGALLLILSSSENEQITKISLISIVAIMIIAMILFVRDLFTFITTLIFICMIISIIIKAGHTINNLFLDFLAIQCCFYSLYNINVVFGLSIKGHGQNDAAMLQNLTFIPAPIWAIAWLILSFITFFFVVKLIYKSA